MCLPCKILINSPDCISFFPPLICENKNPCTTTGKPFCFIYRTCLQKTFNFSLVIERTSKGNYYKDSGNKCVSCRIKKLDQKKKD